MKLINKLHSKYNKATKQQQKQTLLTTVIMVFRFMKIETLWTLYAEVTFFYFEQVVPL